MSYNCNTEGCSLNDCPNCLRFHEFRTRALTAESILREFVDTPCTTKDESCLCIHCQARAYFRVTPRFFAMMAGAA